MKKKIVFLPMLFLMLVCCLFSACRKDDWEIAQSVENISKIEIVDIYLDNVSVICEIDSSHNEEVVQDVQALPVYKYFGDPTRPAGKSIKITFMDGKYDLISKHEPRHVLEPERGFIYSKSTRRSFEPDAFDKLIEKWSSTQ